MPTGVGLRKGKISGLMLSFLFAHAGEKKEPRRALSHNPVSLIATKF
jgi:hypothetical protein